MTKKLNEKQSAKFWDEVNLLAQEKIYSLLTANFPLPGLKLITHSFSYTEQQQNLTGLFLRKDTDYRTLLLDIESSYYDQDLPSKEALAEEIAMNYLHLQIKAIIADLKGYTCYEDFYFENLTGE